MTSSSQESRIVDLVHERLCEAIFSGELPAGARLSVPALAEWLDVSRSPVREAVLRLTQERLAREEPRRGAVVARLTAGELAELYSVREVLEGLVTRLAVENAGRRLVDRLEGILAEHEHAVRCGDRHGHMDADMRFHASLRHAAGNPEASRMLEQIQARVRLAMLSTVVTAGPEPALADHHRIHDAVRSGDPAEAERVARAHVARLRDALLEQAEAE